MFFNLITILNVGFYQDIPKEHSQPVLAQVKSLHDWQTDERLQKRVSIASKCMSMASLADWIYEHAGVRLRADNEFSDKKIQIVLKNRSLVEVMTSLSELYGGTWSKRNEEFYFNSDPNLLRKKTAWWYAFNAERTKTLLDVPRQLKSVMTKRKPDWGILQNKQGDDLLRSKNALHQMQFWYDLPPVMQEVISNSISDEYSYARHRFVLPIISEGVAIWPFTSLPASSAESLEYMLSQTNPGIDRSQIMYVSVKSGMGSLFVNVTVKGLGSDGSKISTGSTGISLRYPNRQKLLLLGLDHSGLQDTLVKSGQRPSNYQKRLIDFQSQTFWKNDLSKSNKKVGPKYNFDGLNVVNNDGTSPSPSDLMRDSALPRLCDMLGKLTPNIEFIADYYSIPYRPLTKEEWSTKVRDVVEEDINDLAKEYDCSWKRQPGNLFLIRNNRWYREDSLEVPMRVASELEKSSRQAQNVQFTDPNISEMYLTLEMASVAATRLSKWQIANGLYYYTREERIPEYEKTTQQSSQKFIESYREADCQPYTGVALMALMYNKTCHFYASLGHQERIKLLTGALLLGDLNKRQQELLIAAFPNTATMSDSSVISFKGKKGMISMSNPYLYGAKSGGALPFKIELQ